MLKRRKQDKILKQIIALFRKDYPLISRELSKQEFKLLFKLYRKSYFARRFHRSDVSLLVAGTLVILISSLFMNAGAKLSIVDLD